MKALFPWPPPPPREEDDEAMVAAKRMVRLVVGGLIDTAIGVERSRSTGAGLMDDYNSPADMDLDPPPILRE